MEYCKKCKKHIVRVIYEVEGEPIHWECMKTCDAFIADKRTSELESLRVVNKEMLKHLQQFASPEIVKYFKTQLKGVK
jgi:hypothetical protein